jgi:hypothetical protein
MCNVHKRVSNGTGDLCKSGGGGGEGPVWEEGIRI